MAHASDPIPAALSSCNRLKLRWLLATGETDDLFHACWIATTYLGCRGHVGEHIKYLVYDCKASLAALLFRCGGWKVSAREQFIGWR